MPCPGVSDARTTTGARKFCGIPRLGLAEKKAREKENQQLHEIVAELKLNKLILKETVDFFKGKGLTMKRLRDAVFHTRQKFDTSERRKFNDVGFARSTLRYQPQQRNDDDLRLAKQYGRYGYRKITKLLRVDGWRINHKKVKRL